MERRPISVNLRKFKINDIKTEIFFTTFKVIYFNADRQAHKGMPYRINADNNIIIPQAHKGMPYRNPRSFDQVMGF